MPTMNARACAANEDSQLNDRDVISLTVIDFITNCAFGVTCLHFLKWCLHGRLRERLREPRNVPWAFLEISSIRDLAYA